MVYKGLRTGVGCQILSLIGWFVLIFFSIGYYNYFSKAIFGFLLQKWSQPVSFFVISAVIFVVIKLLERVFNVMNSEESAPIERIGGAILASFRGCMLFGAIGMLLILTPMDQVRASAMEGSKTCMLFVNLDAQLYSWMTKVAKISGVKGREEVVDDLVTSTRKGKEDEA
jgi:uncharacterized membrane protein required for colicin V production